VGIGKSIEAPLVIAQKWAELRRRELDAGDPGAGERTSDRPQKLAAAIAELDGYRELALKIGQNAKGIELVKAPPARSTSCRVSTGCLRLGGR